MKKLFLTLFFTAKDHDCFWVKIIPFVWHLYPSIHGQRNQKRKHIEYIDIYMPRIHNFDSTWEYSIDDFTRYCYSRFIGYPSIFKFLCFEIGFIRKELSDVGKIYPKGYNYKNDSVETIYKRWKDLSDTEFFDKI